MLSVWISLIVGILACALGVAVTYAFARERARLAEATYLQGLAERERAAEVMHGTIREQAARMRDADIRLSTAVEAERQATEGAQQAREALKHELEHTRAALKRVQAEWAGLNAELVALRSDKDSRLYDITAARDQLQADLASERMNAVSSEAGLHAEVARLREERSVIAMERDALIRERDLLCEAADRERTILRRRVHHARELIKRAREQTTTRVAAERQNGMDLVHRLWDYLKPQDAPVMPPAAVPTEPIMADTAPPMVDVEVERPVLVESGLADGHPTRAPMPEPAMSDRAAPKAAPTTAPLADDNGADVGLTVHTLPANLRRPMSVIQDGDTMRVVCDDGAVWERGPDGWYESAPLPGSRSDAIHKFQDGISGPRPR